MKNLLGFWRDENEFYVECFTVILHESMKRNVIINLPWCWLQYYTRAAQKLTQKYQGSLWRHNVVIEIGCDLAVFGRKNNLI